MSTITRAFTKRNKRPEVSAPMPYRGEGHVRFNSGSIKRGNISGPVQLLSTTNMLAYNAPDLNSISPNSSSASSLRSRDDSDFSISPHSYSSSITTPEHEPEPVDYFPKRSATVTSHPRSSATSSSSTEAPLIPKRALSHTKRSHQELARKRSQHRFNPTMRASQDMFRAEAHPFSKELEQVNEVAEEFGATPLMDEEERILRRKGLQKFSVDDYLFEIQDLYGSIFDDKLGPLSTGAWL
ncbi:hypothetical protein N7481_004786 [Penicillium waksmanii]|uniref:uncharacterized protein n=1 Tax=Penicillium waksmanii TaxID=69791 RepID=UPI002549862E|nr:uncharacterized protein N7481_004786 [Penicillium waksmanii]KAJ5989576.1 hypothetical protein N7481_004786 [Penicillium waksmanii]